MARVVHRADIQRLERIVQRHGGRGAWAGADDERSLGGRCPSESRQLELRQRPCTTGLLGRAARAVGVARARVLSEGEGGHSQGDHLVVRVSRSFERPSRNFRAVLAADDAGVHQRHEKTLSINGLRGGAPGARASRWRRIRVGVHQECRAARRRACIPRRWREKGEAQADQGHRSGPRARRECA